MFWMPLYTSGSYCILILKQDIARFPQLVRHHSTAVQQQQQHHQQAAQIIPSCMPARIREAPAAAALADVVAVQPMRWEIITTRCDDEHLQMLWREKRTKGRNLYKSTVRGQQQPVEHDLAIVRCDSRRSQITHRRDDKRLFFISSWCAVSLYILYLLAKNWNVRLTRNIVANSLVHFLSVTTLCLFLLFVESIWSLIDARTKTYYLK